MLDEPRERLVRLIGEAFGGDDGEGDGRPTDVVHTAAFTLAVADAADDPIVRPVLRRVTERRIAFLEAELRALGLSAEEAAPRALLAYAGFVGALRLVREAPDRLPRGAAGAAYRRHLVATLLPEVEG